MRSIVAVNSSGGRIWRPSQQPSIERRETDQLQACVLTDGGLSAWEVSLETADLLAHAGPWGQAFEEPLFDGAFEVIWHRVLKEKYLKLRLRHPSGGDALDAIAFNAEDTLSLWSQSGVPLRIEIVYRLDVNEYQGNRQVQLLVQRMACR